MVGRPGLEPGTTGLKVHWEFNGHGTFQHPPSPILARLSNTEHRLRRTVFTTNSNGLGRLLLRSQVPHDVKAKGDATGTEGRVYLVARDRWVDIRKTMPEGIG